METPRYLTEAQVGRLTLLSRSTIWRERRKGSFPSPRKLAPGRIGYLESEIATWLASRPVVNEHDARET